MTYEPKGRHDMDGLIEIRVSNGDWAEADDAAGAILAARTMMTEAADLHGSALTLLRVTFLNTTTQKIIAADLRYRELGMSLAAA